MIKGKRIDEVKDKRIRNIKQVKIIDKKTIEITVHNQKEPITLVAKAEDFGYDSGIYIVQEEE